MRLTLRTMLAYLDDLLEPGDAEQIGEKIRDSESASNLASRICDVTRRLRLGTPKVSGRGGGVNPNTVAEYLDNTLSTERVPEFERACLESDVQLAEVASCHQVLTLVLGEPAEVTPDSRQRMYKLLGSRRLTADGSRVAAEASVDAAEKKKKKRRKRRRTVPDYLREGDAPTRRRWPLVAALSLAAMVVVAALFGLSRLSPDSDNTSAEQLADASVADDDNVTAPAHGPPDTNVELPAEDTDTSAADTPGEGATPEDIAPNEFVPGDPSAAPPMPATIDDRPPMPPTGEPALAGTDRDGASEEGSDGQSSDAQDRDLEDTVVEHTDVEDDNVASDAAAPTGAKLEQPGSIAGRFRPSAPGALPDEVGDTRPADDEPAPLDDAPDEAPLAATADPDDPAADSDTPEEGVGSDGEPLADDPQDSDPLVGTPGAAMGMGRFISNDSELLRYDPDEFAWQRVADRRMLQAGDELLSLPVYRPFLTFSDVSVQLVGATHIRILPPDAGETIGLQCDYGRMVLMSAGMAGASVRLRLGDDEVLVTFDDADATVALEVLPRLDPGTEPANAPITRAAHLFVASGTISISGGPGAVQSLEAPVQLALTPAAADEAAAGDEMPDWINSDAYIKQLDRSAAQQIHAILDEDVPLRRSLQELAEHRRVEIRSLAARQLSYLDEFDAVVSALDNEQQRASWPDHFDALRHGVARGQGSSQKVLLALEKRHGNATAADIHRMLWGYTKDQLTEGHAAQLVGFLDDDQLSLRVLAFLNLEEITGKGGGYQPQHNALRRRRAVTSWREKYEAGEIVPLEEDETAPTP